MIYYDTLSYNIMDLVGKHVGGSGHVGNTDRIDDGKELVVNMSAGRDMPARLSASTTGRTCR